MNWFQRLQVGRDLVWLLVSFGVLIAGVGVLSTGVALALDKRNFTDPLAQFVPSLYYVGMALGSAAGRYWLRWLGPVRLFIGCAAVGALTCLLALLATSPGAWAALRLLQGGCLAGIYISVEVVLNMATPNRQRGRTIAGYQVVTYIGMAMGQWMVGYLWWGEVSWFPVAAVLLALGGALAWRKVRVRQCGADPQRVATTEVIEGPASGLTGGSIRFGLYVAGIAGVLLSSFYTVFPVVVHGLLNDLPTTGNYLGLATLAALPALFLVAHHADRLGRKQVIYAVSVVMTLALLLLTFLSDRWLLWVGGMVYAGLVFTVYGLGIGDVNDRVEAKRREAAASSVMLMFSLGGCLGPWLSGLAYAEGGAPWYFMVSAAAALSMFLVGAGAVIRLPKFRLRRSF